MTTHGEIARFIDRHFAATISVEDERRMRLHLPDCAACNTRYRRHLLLAKLDRRALSPRQRLARGLGLPAPAPPRRWGAPAILAAAALAVLALVAWPHVRLPAVDGVAARGAGRTSAGFVWIYRVAEGAPPRLVTDVVTAKDDLAFAYSNPASKRYLAIFGCDEHGHVYWYYPGWPAGAQPPGVFRARAGAGPFELAESVRHALDGRRLDLYAIFSDEPLSVATLERATTAPGGLDATIRDAGATIVRRSFEVRP